MQSFSQHADAATACQPGSASHSPAQSSSDHTQPLHHKAAGSQAAAEEADANADTAAAAVLATSGSTCSSSQPPACQGGAAAASQPTPQQREEVIQAIAAEINESEIVGAVAQKMHELVGSVSAVTQQLKRVKTLQVRPTKMTQLKPCKCITPGCSRVLPGVLLQPLLAF